ncbi:MAG: clan AA aspartic protease [Candidatus Obscuribacter sp.]|nr:clan AA aspartic protease [Candidatus Obscuribacter sp.]
MSNYGGGGPIGGTAASNPGDYIPDECRVYCTRESNCLVLDARISNRPIKMIFDTGAESTVLGKNHLAELGLPAPTGNPIGTTMGVGEGGGQRCWQSNLEITVGNITRKKLSYRSARAHAHTASWGRVFSIRCVIPSTITASILSKRLLAAVVRFIHVIQ